MHSTSMAQHPLRISSRTEFVRVETIADLQDDQGVDLRSVDQIIHVKEASALYTCDATARSVGDGWDAGLVEHVDVAPHRDDRRLRKLRWFFVPHQPMARTDGLGKRF